ncbi:MAG: hypothetical protein QF516_13380, partial [Pirellulaceae bacterium]|nr:hypothetical protein [Pirellulaceae bacterium]
VPFAQNGWAGDDLSHPHALDSEEIASAKSIRRPHKRQFQPHLMRRIRLIYKWTEINSPKE